MRNNFDNRAISAIERRLFMMIMICVDHNFHHNLRAIIFLCATLPFAKLSFTKDYAHIRKRNYLQLNSLNPADLICIFCVNLREIVFEHSTYGASENLNVRPALVFVVG